MKLLIALMISLQTMDTNGQVAGYLKQFATNKTIPPAVEKNVLTALSFFPELKQTNISFIMKPKLTSSVMQAQPVFRTLLQRRKNRRYRINISTEFRLISSILPILEIPDNVMIGWIGHELGHILDYEGMSNVKMITFGYRYYTSSKFVKHAEMMADSLAVERGMGNYIVTTKRFILDHADLPKAYKDKISRLYLSPDVIVEQVKLWEEKMLEQKNEEMKKEEEL
ncbi:hypothetical protein [Aridibaculum aurantiacum]|uniref:hypothetical protein n=1 Tax=Aridibaculum aurantiacum TaxID=2810307 RepID=UPI001F6183AE|nr:hypothetical protein [Aridibaculum aurantiacum]